MSSWKLVGPNSLRLFCFNPVIAVVEAAGGDEFLCFATLRYEFSVLDCFWRGRCNCEMMLQGVFQILLFSYSDYYFCCRKCEQYLSSFLSYALVSDIFTACDCWCFGLKGLRMPNQLNAPQWFQLSGHVKFLCSVYVPREVYILIIYINIHIYLYWNSGVCIIVYKELFPPVSNLFCPEHSFFIMISSWRCMMLSVSVEP